MRNTRRKDLDRSMRILGAAFVSIRFAAHSGDAERARRLADAFHNIPPMIAVGTSANEVVAELRRKCERHHETAALDEILTFAGESA